MKNQNTETNPTSGGASASPSCSLNPPKWWHDLRDRVFNACKAFKNDDDYPDAWLYLGEDWRCESEGLEVQDWYDWGNEFLGRPIYHAKASLQHSGHDGEPQVIVPLWFGDVSTKAEQQREFECRLANSGDF